MRVLVEDDFLAPEETHYRVDAALVPKQLAALPGVEVRAAPTPHGIQALRDRFLVVDGGEAWFQFGDFAGPVYLDPVADLRVVHANVSTAYRFRDPQVVAPLAAIFEARWSLGVPIPP